MNGMTINIFICALVVGFLSIWIFYLVRTYLKLTNRKDIIMDKFEEIDIQLTKKLDEVKNLIDEAGDDDIINARYNLLTSVKINDKIRNNKYLDNLIYEFKNNSKNIKKILDKIFEINDKIDYAKEFYNSSIEEYNQILDTIGGKTLKFLFGFVKYNPI